MPLSWNEIKSRALTFSRTWADAANEDSQGKPFWIDFFEIFGITDKRVATFEHAVKKLLGDKARVDGFVDLFWPGMLLVEQKSRGKNLDAALTQALSYFPGIAERDLPQIIIVCDFARFRVHKLATGETIEFSLKDLHKHIKLFGFVAGYKVQTIQPQNPVNIKAAERMGRLHDALKASGYTGHPLELLLVRLLFCLFADDTGIFQPAQVFRTFVEERTSADGSDLGSRLAQLFQTLNTEESKRSKALDEQVAAFPYVNGKLFEESLPMADFTAAMREALLDACALDWSAISPAIFGSLFQSIMDDKARRNLGAHYTSEENILKLIKPLFLDDLWAEFEKVKSNRNKLFEFHKKLRLLTFFDPACGCGNFLVISYRELRLLELEVLRASNTAGQMSVDVHQLIGVNVDQFYGIEIEEFPAQIAQVALWLMDHQMNLRVSEEFGLYFARIPLRTTPRIVHDNALRLDWDDVLPAKRCSFLLGNPPFVGAMVMSESQRDDMGLVFSDLKGYGVLDFVSCWYWKAAKYMVDEDIKAAFVSTNSITQGEQAGLLWAPLMQKFGLHITFAHRTFRWSNEAKGVAAVHCVIIGFSRQAVPQPRLFEYEQISGEPNELPSSNINAYLVDAPDTLLTNRSVPICNVPPMHFGSMPRDGGHLILDNHQKAELLAIEPAAARWLRPYTGSQEFINRQTRWCLWLVNAPPSELRALPQVMARVQRVKDFRLASTAASTRKFAATPTLFCQIAQPTTDYLLVPGVSSERREFIPIGFLASNIVASNLVFVVPDATLFHFAVLSSTMHNAWVRYTCGRLKSDYRYSKDIVYNNFPWPDLEPNQPVSQAVRAKAAIETAAHAVLDTRAHFLGSSLADLYDPLSMPPALVKAHQRLDAAVDAAYALGGGKKTWKNDADRVAYLFELYQKYTSLLPATGVPKRKRAAKLVA
ncbi:MAG: class I SAM-dependent DNA methyltransferase [Polaromonas sp.]|nr:class I SAM-dependent DNA methyltransferase [Polaromonas sp.]MDP3753469.1 class I SAM-dependent DNA methyltransferase [Polaromonas sp.]